MAASGMAASGMFRAKTKAAAAPAPLPEPLVALLAEWQEQNPARQYVLPTLSHDRPWTGGGPGLKPLDQIKIVARAAKVDHVTAKALRHTWATLAENEWQLSELQIQRVLRHTSTRTQRTYRKAFIDSLRELGGRVCFGIDNAKGSRAAG